jgi:type II secretory pathway component PulF
MDEPPRQFAYVALDHAGRRTRGVVCAQTDDAAFKLLRGDGLSPLRISRARSAGASHRRLSDRQTAEFLSNLSALLAAGADMRAALSILTGHGDQSPERILARELAVMIGGGTSLEESFSALLGKNGPFVGALLSAGDLPGGLRRAAEVLQSRTKIKDQLVGALSYPTFVLISTLAALAVILLVVAPALAPLVADAGSERPLILGLLIAFSDLIRSNATVVTLALAAALAALFAMARLGLLTRSLERACLDGPFSRTSNGLVFGGFAIALGSMLGAGASMSDALHLSIRSVRITSARQRLEPVLQAVRQGTPLSVALLEIPSFPRTIGQMAEVGESTGALGPMLARAGRIEEDSALARIEAAGRVLGPALIVGLGALIGLIMAGLLTGVSQLGQTALQ